jgi:glycosyltransferase involved in cell wall biosynthesis
VTTIFVNGVKSKTGGGRGILTDYLGVLVESESPHQYVVLTPNKSEYENYSRKNIAIVDIPDVYKHNVLFPALYRVVLPRLLRHYRVDVILNFGDIVIPSAIPQLYLFDWPYAVYRDSVAWGRLGFSSYCAQKVKLIVFKRYLGYATVVIAQTATMKARLEGEYRLQNVTVVPSAVPLTNMDGGQPFDFGLPRERTKLLYVAYYYPHKNFEVLIPLARLIRDRGLTYQIITTISPLQHPKAALFLQAVTNEGLEGVITNLGPVEPAHVPSLYSQCDALLMPTLIETFALPYVEAMFHEKVILTSRRDFAEDVCGSAAFYFEPLDPDSILRTIESAFGSPLVSREKVREGKNRLSRVPNAKQVFGRYQELLDQISSDL